MEMEGGTTEERTDEQVQAFAQDERLIHLAGLGRPRRPGVMLFATKLEHLHFPPGTEKNEQFNVHIIRWEDMDWIVISIPKEHMALARKVATGAGLRIADGVPTKIEIGKGNVELIESFPMNSENVFTLENLPWHEIYNNDPMTREQSIEKENIEVAEILSNSSQGKEAQ